RLWSSGPRRPRTSITISSGTRRSDVPASPDSAQRDGDVSSTIVTAALRARRARSGGPPALPPSMPDGGLAAPRKVTAVPRLWAVRGAPACLAIGLLACSTACARGGGAPPGGPPDGQRFNVVLLTVDTLRPDPQGRKIHLPSKNDHEATLKAAAWLRARKADAPPFFLWMRYTAPHWPYDPPAPYAEMFDGAYRGPHTFNDEPHPGQERGDI